MFTGQIGHQRPFVRCTNSQGKNTHNWPSVWDHQWTLKSIMNKDSCTVSRLVNLSVILSLKFFGVFFVDIIINFCLCIDLRIEIHFLLQVPTSVDFPMEVAPICVFQPQQNTMPLDMPVLVQTIWCSWVENNVVKVVSEAYLWVSSVHITATLSKSPKRRMQVIALIVGREFNVQFHLHLSCVYVTALTWL